MKLYNENNELIKEIESYEFVEGDMGESSITSNLKFYEAQNFHPGWHVEYDGEKFSLNTRKPTGYKDTNSLATTYTLVFQSEREDLKRFTFMDFVELGVANPQPTSYIVSFNGTLTQFVYRFNLNLQHYLGTRWMMTLPQDYVESREGFIAVFDNMSLWDVLIKVYEIFHVRWTIRADGDILKIKLAEPPVEIEHIFEYGKDNGLVKVARNNKLERIITRLRGLGAERNLPPDYFHNGDPDTNEPLGNVFYKRLLPSVYRDYIRGYNSGQGPDGTWAYNLGVSDKMANRRIAPVDFVLSDNEELWGISYGAIEPNDNIYPTLQGIEESGIGRLDEIVDAEQVLSDTPPTEEDIVEETKAGYTFSWGERTVVDGNVAAADGNYPNCRGTVVVIGEDNTGIENFTIEPGENCNSVNLNLQILTMSADPGACRTRSVVGGRRVPARSDEYKRFVVLGFISIFRQNDDPATATPVYTKQILPSDPECEIKNFEPGSYKILWKVTAHIDTNEYPTAENIFLSVEYKIGYQINIYNPSKMFKSTFDIWIKNIWGTEQGANETDADYSYRVWEPLAVTSEEMTVLFSDGYLAGEDYEFRIVGTDENDANKLKTIIANAIHPDRSKLLNGVRSEWRLTLEKSDAELDASGKYLPNLARQATAGDHFFFINIKMPYDPYVYNAEQRLTDYLEEQLALKDEEYPNLSISPSSIFCHNFAETQNIRAGAKIRVYNEALVGSTYMTLYIRSVTKKYSKDKLNPEWSLTVSDEVLATGNPLELLQGDVKTLSLRVNSKTQMTQDAAQSLQSVFLRKDGLPDTSYSPTTFRLPLKIEAGIQDKNFINGDISGSGFGVYTDEHGNRVVEADILIGRIGARFNEVVINQVTYCGGKRIFTGAGMTVSGIEENADSWRCYFDTKNGAIYNMFETGDGAFSERFGLTGVRYYWARIVNVGYDFIEISKTDKLSGSSDPIVGDTIVHLGNDTNTARQAALVIDEVRDGGGLVTWYDDIDGFTLEGKNSVEIGRIDGKTWLRVYGSAYIGDRDNNYLKLENNELSFTGKLCVGTVIDMGDGNAAHPIVEEFDSIAYLRESFKNYESTTIVRGLVLTNKIVLGQNTSSENPIIWCGISGQYETDRIGGGLAAWYGGAPIDRENLLDGEQQDNAAKSAFRFDGSGYVGNGNISWNANGNVTLRKTLIQSDSGVSAPIGCYRGPYDAGATYFNGDEVTYTSGGVTSSYRYTYSTPASGKAPTNATYWSPVAKGSKGAKGNPGADAPYTVYRFRKNGSPDAPPEVREADKTALNPTGWSADIPAAGLLEYVWRIEALVKADGTALAPGAKWSVPVRISGIRGNDGTPGTPGVSYTGTDEYYQWGDSATDAPTGEWTMNVIPARPSGKRFLWNYEKIKRSDGTSQTTQKRPITSDGRGIKSITEWYMTTATNAAPAADAAGWTTERITPTDANPYLWNKEVIEYTEGGPDTFVHILAVKGKDGTDGAVGDVGPAILFRGNYSSGERYYGTARRVDVVCWNNLYYVARTDAGEFQGTAPGGTGNAKWNDFGANFTSVATTLLLAELANVGGWIFRSGRLESQDGTGTAGQPGWIPNIALDGRGEGVISIGGNTRITRENGFHIVDDGGRIVTQVIDSPVPQLTNVSEYVLRLFIHEVNSDFNDSSSGLFWYINAETGFQSFGELEAGDKIIVTGADGKLVLPTFHDGSRLHYYFGRADRGMITLYFQIYKNGVMVESVPLAENGAAGPTVPPGYEEDDYVYSDFIFTPPGGGQRYEYTVTEKADYKVKLYLWDDDAGLLDVVLPEGQSLPTGFEEYHGPFFFVGHYLRLTGGVERLVRTIVGNDGLFSYWGHNNYALVSSKDGIFLNCGDNGLKITGSGIKKIVNGVETPL